MANETTARVGGAGRASGSPELLCQVVTPERKLLDRRVTFLAVPLFDGEIGIAPGRAPMVGRLGTGELRITDNQGVSRFFLDGGFIQVLGDRVSVLTNDATPAELIDPEQARATLERAEKLPASTLAEADAKSAAVRRARAMIRISGRVGAR